MHSIAAHYLLNHGTEEQKRRYLPRLASGELIGAIGMTEPGAGSDLQGIRTRAERHGAHYVINGSKIFITNGYLAGLVMLVVKTDTTLGAKGTSILLVETHDLPGYRVGRFLDKVGQRAQDTTELFFEDVHVPAECLLGATEGKGFAKLMSDLPYERMIVAVQAMAAMEGGLDETVRYVMVAGPLARPRWSFRTRVSAWRRPRPSCAWRVPSSTAAFKTSSTASSTRHGIDGEMVEHDMRNSAR